MSLCSDIGISRKQKVYAVAQSDCTTLVFPSSAEHMIIPAGNATINQAPEFVDSEEIVNSLDIINQFQNATPPGEWTVPMYIRPGGFSAGVILEPQGGVLFKNLQGEIGTVTTGSTIYLATDVPLSDPLSYGTLDIENITSRPPECGIILIGTELIKYYDSTYDLTAGTATLTYYKVDRGYNGTTVAAHLGATNPGTISVSWKSKWYKQSTSSDPFSLWVQTDHFTQGLSGCSVNGLTLSVTNEGAVMAEFSGQGMQMVWAGTDILTVDPGAAATSITVSDADRFSVGSYIWNETKEDHRSTAGYKITNVNTGTNVLTLANATVQNWDLNDVISGYLPEFTTTKLDPIESKDTLVYMDTVESYIKSGDITFDTPKEYIVDEVGTDYPQTFVENTRSITSSLGLYFRKADAKYFNEGYNGSTKILHFIFGNTAGSRMELYAPKAQFTVPSIDITAPTVSLTIDTKFLGSVGEDSVDLVFT